MEENKPREDFVDRWNHRWQMLQTIEPELSRLLVLYGNRKVGQDRTTQTL